MLHVPPNYAKQMKCKLKLAWSLNYSVTIGANRLEIKK